MMSSNFALGAIQIIRDTLGGGQTICHQITHGGVCHASEGRGVRKNDTTCHEGGSKKCQKSVTNYLNDPLGPELIK